jgi:hypothetical protein
MCNFPCLFICLHRLHSGPARPRVGVSQRKREKFYVAISGRQLLNQPTKPAIPLTLTLTARKCTSLQCSRLGQLLPPSCSRLLHLKQFSWTRLTTMGGYRYWISYFRYAISDIVLFSLIRSFRYPTNIWYCISDWQSRNNFSLYWINPILTE